MKKIILLSDSHNSIDERVFPHLNNCDEIWHAGDIGKIEIIDVLKKYAYLPPPTLDELKFSFNVLLPSILQNLPSQNKSFLNDKINWIISSIKLRKSEISDGNEPYDFVSNVEYYLDKENLDKVLDNFENLPATMKKPALDWFENLNSRISVNNSINAITNNYRNFIK